MKKNKPHLKTTEAPETTLEAPQSQPRWRLVGLACLLVIVAGAFYWNRFVRPQQMIDKANAIAKSDPAKAEQLLADSFIITGSLDPDPHLLRLALLVQMGRDDEVFAILDDLADVVKLPADKLKILAMNASGRGNDLLAEQLLKAGMWDEESRLQLNQWLLELYFASGNTPGTIEACQAILEMAPNDAVALRLFGGHLHAQKQLVQAEDVLRKSVAFSQGDDQKKFASRQLIDVLVDQGKVQSARMEVEKYQELFPDDIEIALKEATVCRLEGKLKQGVVAINRFLDERKPDSPEALYIRGLLYVDLSEMEKAAKDLGYVVAKHPWNHEAQFKLAVTYQRLGDEEKAKEHRQLAERYRGYRVELLELGNKLREAPADETLRKRLAELYELLGNPLQAEQMRRSLSPK